MLAFQINFIITQKQTFFTQIKTLMFFSRSFGGSIFVSEFAHNIFHASVGETLAKFFLLLFPFISTRSPHLLECFAIEFSDPTTEGLHATLVLLLAEARSHALHKVFAIFAEVFANECEESVAAVVVVAPAALELLAVGFVVVFDGIFDVLFEGFASLPSFVSAHESVVILGTHLFLHFLVASGFFVLVFEAFLCLFRIQTRSCEVFLKA